MRRVLVLSFSQIASDPRVMRQVRALAGRYDVTVAGFGAAPEGVASFRALQPGRPSAAAQAAKALRLLARRFEAHYASIAYVAQARAALEGERFDVVVANDLVALPVALHIARGAPVLLDAHEYTPREFEDVWRWRLLFAPFYEDLARRYLPRVAAMTTVCQGIAEEYRRFGVDPQVVLNCPQQQPLPVRPLQDGRVRLVHHGIAVPSRRLELMLEMMRHLDQRFTLDLMLVESDPACMARLRAAAAGDARIRFRPPVPMPAIAETLNDYDIGVFLLPPVNFNYRMALPNKFFEFVQARLAVAIGPSPEMERFVRQYGFGVVADSFEPRALAARIAALTPADIEAMKQRADVASRELHAERASAVFVSEVDRLAG